MLVVMQVVDGVGCALCWLWCRLVVAQVVDGVGCGACCGRCWLCIVLVVMQIGCGAGCGRCWWCSMTVTTNNDNMAAVNNSRSDRGGEEESEGVCGGFDS